MSRFTGSGWKVSRRLNYSISETGKELKKRAYAPGQHGQNQAKLKEYGEQLREKQRVRFTYGVSEKQFAKTFDRASKMSGMTGVNFLQLLERRLDNLVFRLGFASTRPHARQLVNLGHITVNGKKLDIPSYEVKVGDVISLKDSSKNLKVVKEALEKSLRRKDYVEFDEKELKGKLTRIPDRSEFLEGIDELKIVEYYNRA